MDLCYAMLACLLARVNSSGIHAWKTKALNNQQINTIPNLTLSQCLDHLELFPSSIFPDSANEQHFARHVIHYLRCLRAAVFDHLLRPFLPFHDASIDLTRTVDTMMRIPCSRGPLSRALFRPFARARRYSALQTPAPAAVAPPSTEETDTDVALAVHPNVFKTTGALWVSGVLPLKLSRVDVRHLFVPDSRRSLREIAEKSIVPSGIFERGFGILEVIPAPKEGGMVLRWDRTSIPRSPADD